MTVSIPTFLSPTSPLDTPQPPIPCDTDVLTIPIADGDHGEANENHGDAEDENEDKEDCVLFGRVHKHFFGSIHK